MDKLLIRKDVAEELIEKGYGKKDLSKLQKVQIVDKNGHTRNVYKKTSVEQKEGRQPKAQEELTSEKKAKYEEMLRKVKAGPEENALLVKGKALNKKEAIEHLEEKLGVKNGKEDVASKSFDDYSKKRLSKLGFEPKGDVWVHDEDGRKEEIRVRRINTPTGVYATAQLYVNGNHRALDFGGSDTVSPEQFSKLERLIKEQRRDFQPALTESAKEKWKKTAEKYSDAKLKEIVDSFPNPKGLMGAMFDNPSVQRIIKEEYEKRIGAPGSIHPTPTEKKAKNMPESVIQNR